jgi:DNA-binding NtrC family response regulator
LQSVATIREACVDLVADRFLVCDGETPIDLATGDRVEIIVSSSGGLSEQARWAARCDRLARLHHRSLARLVDYGPLGEGRRFEAWRSDGVWRGSAHERDCTRKRVEELFRAARWSVAFDSGAVRRAGGHAVVLPDAQSGFDEERAEGRCVETLDQGLVAGLTEISRQSVALVAEIFSDRIYKRCRAVAICGPPGSGRDTVLVNLARAARLSGFVPLAAERLRANANAILEERSIALLIRSNFSDGWRALLQWSLVSPKPHVVVFAGLSPPRGVRAVTLERITSAALKEAVYPNGFRRPTRRQLTAAARRARGLPGRFEALVWGERNMQQRQDGDRPSRVAESVRQYGQDEDEEAIRAERGRLVEWPVAGELDVLRKRFEAAVALTSRGRHAAGDRALRQLTASLTRRHDWQRAGEAGFILATSLVKRGQPRDARAVLEQAREAAVHAGQHNWLNRIAVLTGVALIEEGRLDEAEAVLSAAVSAAIGLEDAGAQRTARLALARCYFWRGQFDSGAASLAALDGASVCEEDAIRIAVMQSRLAIGQGSFDRAITQSCGAVERAQRTRQSELLMLAACAAALAHLAVGDHNAVVSDVSLAVKMARLSHNPLFGLRARLIVAESHRRHGRRGPGVTLVNRVRRLKSSPVPALVRARVDLLSHLISEDGNESDVIKRLVQATGLEGLVLFAPGSRPGASHPNAVSDIISILQCCQNADEEGRLLIGVCVRLRSRLEATAVAFFVEEGGMFTAIASDGSRIDAGLGPRLAALDQTIAPHFFNGRLEAGAPVRYGGHRLGVLIARWSLGSACDSKDVVTLLATAATAAGPAVASVLARRAAATPRSSELIGISTAIVEVRSAIDRAATAPFAVLVEGESGTGKELIARALHRQGSRRERPFCTLNCAALPDDLVESELFGHSRGAFTGAVAERPGVFEEAHTGTLFLDEIGELSLRAQAKVLRTVQEGELRRVGENIARRIDVRLVAATNRDLRREVSAGRFRLDLLYRLDVIRIALPPLRDRRDDIPLLAEHFWRDATGRIGSRATLSLATLAQLARYDWPGNVRELQNVLAALAVRTPRRGVVQPSALPPNFNAAGIERASRLDAARRTFDTQFIRAALARTGGHRARAARELGVTRQGLTKLMNRLGLHEEVRAEP